MSTAVLEAAALACAAAAVVCATAVLLRTREVRTALPVLLDLLLAAGLLRLSTSRSAADLATTAVLLLLRQLVVQGLRTAAAVR